MLSDEVKPETARDAAVAENGRAGRPADGGSLAAGSSAANQPAVTFSNSGLALIGLHRRDRSVVGG